MLRNEASKHSAPALLISLPGCLSLGESQLNSVSQPPPHTGQCSFMLAFDQRCSSWQRQPCQQKPSVGEQVVLIGSREEMEMGDAGKSSSARKLPPQEQGFNAAQNSCTCLVSPGSSRLSPSSSKMIRATPMKNMLVNGVGFSVISSQ